MDTSDVGIKSEVAPAQTEVAAPSPAAPPTEDPLEFCSRILGEVSFTTFLTKSPTHPKKSHLQSVQPDLSRNKMFQIHPDDIRRLGRIHFVSNHPLTIHPGKKDAVTLRFGDAVSYQRQDEWKYVQIRGTEKPNSLTEMHLHLWNPVSCQLVTDAKASHVKKIIPQPPFDIKPLNIPKLNDQLCKRYSELKGHDTSTTKHADSIATAHSLGADSYDLRVTPDPHLKELQQQVAALQADLEKKSTQVTALKTKVEAAKNTAQDLTRQVKKLTSENKSLSSKLAEERAARQQAEMQEESEDESEEEAQLQQPIKKSGKTKKRKASRSRSRSRSRSPARHRHHSHGHRHEDQQPPCFGGPFPYPSAPAFYNQNPAALFRPFHGGYGPY